MCVVHRVAIATCRRSLPVRAHSISGRPGPNLDRHWPWAWAEWGQLVVWAGGWRLGNCGRRGRWSKVQGDGRYGGADAVSGWQQDPSGAEAADHLAVVVAGQGVRVAAYPAGITQHRIDVPPAWVIGMQGGGDVLGRAAVGQQTGRGEDRVFRAVNAAVAIDGPGCREELHGPLRASGARAGHPAEVGLDEIDRRQVRPSHASSCLRRLV